MVLSIPLGFPCGFISFAYIHLATPYHNQITIFKITTIFLIAITLIPITHRLILNFQGDLITFLAYLNPSYPQHSCLTPSFNLSQPCNLMFHPHYSNTTQPYHHRLLELKSLLQMLVLNHLS